MLYFNITEGRFHAHNEVAKGRRVGHAGGSARSSRYPALAARSPGRSLGPGRTAGRGTATAVALFPGRITRPMRLQNPAEQGRSRMAR